MTRIETVRLCHFAQGPADDLLTKEVDSTVKLETCYILHSEEIFT